MGLVPWEDHQRYLATYVGELDGSLSTFAASRSQGLGFTRFRVLGFGVLETVLSHGAYVWIPGESRAFKSTEPLKSPKGSMQ